MSKSKIAKLNAEIARTKSRIDEHTTKITELSEKLEELEKQKINIENNEIVALFRREKLSEDEFLALLRSQRKSKPDDNDKAIPPADTDNMGVHDDGIDDDGFFRGGAIPDSDNALG